MTNFVSSAFWILKDGLTRFPLFGVKFVLVLLLPCYRFVDYVSTICEDAAQGKELLTTTINDLFSVPVSGNSEEDSEDHQSSNTVVKVKPTLHWSTVYIQEQTVVCLLLFSFFCFLNHRIFTLATNYSIHLFLTIFPLCFQVFYVFLVWYMHWLLQLIALISVWFLGCIWWCYFSLYAWRKFSTQQSCRCIRKGRWYFS